MELFQLVHQKLRQQKQYDLAEKTLQELEQKHPKNAVIQQKFLELYELTNQTGRIEERKKIARFCQLVPEYTDIDYSEDYFANGKCTFNLYSYKSGIDSG